MRDRVLLWAEKIAVLMPARTAPREWLHLAHQYLAVTIVLDVAITWIVVSALTTRRYGPGTATGLGLLAAVGFVIAVALCRGYRVQRVAGAGEWRATLRTAGVIAMASLALDYLTLVSIPSTVSLPALAATIGLTTSSRVAQRAVVRRRRAHGLMLRRTLVVAQTDGLDQVFSALDEPASHGLTVVGVCTPAGERAADGVIGDHAAVPRLVDELAIDVVLVTAEAMTSDQLRQLGWQLEPSAASLMLLPPLMDVGPHRIEIESTAGTPLLNVSFQTPRSRHWAKGVIDRTVGTALLAVALTVILPAALVVRLTSRGPAFFAQQRVGRGGQEFTMYKLRSMYTDAEARRDLLEESNEGNGLLFKMHHDPRVTPVGRMLRRLSIDELPQLWNVVRGDMALVGPRPALPREVAVYDAVTAHRLHVKPGLTGLWQVNGRSDLGVEKSIRLDLKYVDNWTIGMDLDTLGRTARAVLNGRGAY